MDTANLPSDVSQWWAATRYQLRFYLRTWRFLGLLLFFVIVGGAATGVQIYLHDNGGSAAGFLSGSLGNLQIFGIIIAAFIGGDAIAMDFGGGTGYYMLVLPVRRASILLGRYAAAFVTGLTLVLVYYVITLVGAVFFYGAALPWVPLLESFLLAVLYGAAVLSTAFFFSALFRSPALSIVVTILLLFLGFLIIDGVVGSSLGYEPWFSILYAGNVIGLVLVGAPHYSSTTVTVGARMVTTHAWNPYIWEGVVIMLAYFLIFLFLSGVIYQYKESKG